MKQNAKNNTRKPGLRLWVQLAWTALTNGYLTGYAEGRIYTGSSKLCASPG